jgi:GTP-binding protein
MVNGVILLVDAAEGPMPQTRFVLQRALELNHRVIVCINKIDKPDARLGEVEDEILELLIDLGANDDQLDSPMLYCSGRAGTASPDPLEEGTDLTPLFETILDYIPAPEGDAEGDLQVLVSSVDYNDYVGRIGIGRIERGSVKVGQEVLICNYHKPDEKPRRTKIVSLYQIDGLVRVPVENAKMGDVICFSGAGDISIGDTLTCTTNPEPLEFVKVSEPTVEMTFSVNTSPLAGKEGKFVTSRQLRDRLYRELLKDVSLRVRDGDTTDEFVVSGRGEMHLSILLENMRREGYEMTCSNPKVIFKDIDGEKCEPMERATLDVPNEYVGAVIEKLGQRKGDLIEMNPMGSRMRIEYSIPSRCLFGYRSEFLSATHGEGVINTLFDGYQPYRGGVIMRFTGALVASEAGVTTRYGLYNTQDRGQMFVGPQTEVYEGMIVGENPKNDDIAVNPCKEKHLPAIRSSGADEKLLLTPPKIFSLEEAIEFISDDELIEITPKSIRLRKKILNTELRMKEMMKARRAAEANK